MIRVDMRPAAGFTLIELVIVMVIIAVGLLGMTSLFSNSSTSLSTNETLQQATQYAQECAEKAIATRRNNGFAATASFSCGAAPTGFTRTAGITTYDSTAGCNGHTPCPCPSGGTNNCRDITIAVASGALSSSITVMLVNY